MVSGNQFVAALSDEPAAVDSLDRGTSVRALEQILRRGATPMVLGVYGSWGSGKTSTMRQLEAELATDDDCITVWFDPWIYQFETEPLLPLIQATMEQLGLQKSERFRSLISALGMYGFDWMTSALGLPSIDRLKKFKKWAEDEQFRTRSARAKLREGFAAALAESLDGHNRRGQIGAGRVVFFLDDLDRCEPRTAVALLEGLKLHLNVPNCAFVVGIDPAPVEAAVASLRGLDPSAASDYLEKIVQLPFRLPPLSPAVRRTYVAQLLLELGTASDGGVVELLATAVGDNPRRVKRTVNLFAVAQVMGAETIEAFRPAVLAAIVLLQLRLPEVVRDLAEEEIAFSDLWSEDTGQGSALRRLLRDRDRDLARALDVLDPTLRTVDARPYVFLTALAAETVSDPQDASAPAGTGNAGETVPTLGATARVFPTPFRVTGAPSHEYTLDGRHVSELHG